MKTKNRLLLNYLLLTLLCVILTVVIVLVQKRGLNWYNRVALTECWTLESKGRIETGVSPERASFIVARRGDTFVLSTTVPETDLQYPVLCSYSKYCAVTAESGGQVIYEAGVKEYKEGTVSGCWINQIPLSKLSPERDLTITYTVSEWNAVASLPAHYIISATDVISDFLRHEQFSFSVAVFLLFIGLIGSLIGYTSLILKKRIYPLLAISNFSFWCGLYIFCGNGYILLLSQNYLLNTWLTYLSLYICPITLLAVFYFQIAKTDEGKKITKVFAILFVGFLLVSVALQIVSPVHIMVLSPIFNLLFLAALIVSMVGRIKQIKADKGDTDIVNIGFLVFAIYALTDWIGSSMFHMGYGWFRVENTTYVSIGVLVFVVSSFLTYLSWLAIFTREQSEQASWARMVERDATTGLPSKTKSMHLLQQMHDNELEYSVVTFNIDNYDQIYAEGGDAAVEQVLERYARLVKKVFGNYGICGRMGKTRFIVAAPEMPEAKMKQLSFVFSKYMARENSHVNTLPVETSIGIAFSYKCENKDPLAICQMAEENMRNVLQLSMEREEEVKLLTGEIDPEKQK